MSSWILKVKVGRNWFTIIDLDEELLEYTLGLYENMDKCTDILIYELVRVFKS